MDGEIRTPEIFDQIAAVGDIPVALGGGSLEEDWRLIDRFDAHMQALPPSGHAHRHRFTEKLYIREIWMPELMLCVSKVHKTQHPYAVLEGIVTVFIPGVGRETIRAPHFGITEPGTRRLLFIHERVRWLTFHPTERRDLREIEAEIIEPYHNPLLAVPPPLELPGEVIA